MKNATRTAATAFAAALLLVPAAAPAQYGGPPPANRGYDSAQGEDVGQIVARVSFLSGQVSYARGDDPDNWQPPDVNVPLTLGDRLYTDRGGRAELQIQGGTVVRLDSNTDLAASNLTEDTKQISQNLGSATYQVRRLGADEVFEIDTPNAAVTFDAPGDYRVDVDNDGNSRVRVRAGRVIVASGGGQVTLSAGDEMDIDGIDRPQYDVVALGAPDGFDRWVSLRQSRSTRSRSRQYASEDIVGMADLDASGRWQDIPEYGRVWSPTVVEADWAPYRAGHWIWQDPWGWTWVSSESWGWAPYHYGRWVTSSSRWYWVPDAPRVRVSYAPALVAFVGGGPVSGGNGFVGWFPLAPRDPINPWWGRRASSSRDENVNYVNRSYVTVVNQSTFVSGGLVNRGWVRDQAVVRQVVAAPVVRGPLPFVPTAASLRVAVRPNVSAAPRPPAIVLSRPVVARIAPPPAPPAFTAKIDVIRQNGGAPVAAAAAARLVQERGRPQPVTAFKPVTASGGVTLSRGGRPANGANAAAPSNSAAATEKVVPVQAVRGRPLATSNQPVASPAGAPNAAPPSGTGRAIERGRAQGNPSPVPAGAPVAGANPPSSLAPAPTPAGPPAGADQRRNADPRNRPVVTPLPGNPQAPNGDLPPRGVGRRMEVPTNPPSPAGQPTAAQQNPRGRLVVPPPTARPEVQRPDSRPGIVPPPPATAPPAGEDMRGRGRDRAPAPPPTAAPGAPNSQDLRSRRGMDRAPAAQPTSAPNPPGSEDPRGRRAVDRGPAQGQAPPPTAPPAQDRGRPPAAVERAPAGAPPVTQANDRSATDNRGRGNPPEKPKDNKDNKDNKDKKPDPKKPEPTPTEHGS